jgi:hypothetical protein
MKFRLQIDSDNVAMQDVDDLAYCLEGVAEKVRDGSEAGIVKDINGNKVGEWEVASE